MQVMEIYKRIAGAVVHRDIIKYKKEIQHIYWLQENWQNQAYNKYKTCSAFSKCNQYYANQGFYNRTIKYN